MNNPFASFSPETESEKITQFIRKTFNEANKSTAVIALSGGIDSALSFVLTAKALGVEHIQAFHLPSKTSNPNHLKDVQELIAVFKLPETNFHLIPLKGIIQKTWRTIAKHNPKPNSNADNSSIRLANIAARNRMILLFDAAKKYDALVIGTENHSENRLGYFTRFGDAASDLEPITHLYKTQVIELAKYLNLPENIITKSPSADLWPGQTDAGELGFSYEQADPILFLFDQGKTIDEIVNAGYDEALTRKIVDRVTSQQFKHLVPYTL